MSLFKIRVEAWDTGGVNQGAVLAGRWCKDLDGAIGEAREMYRTSYVGMKKQVTIFDSELERLWQFKDGKTQRFGTQA